MAEPIRLEPRARAFAWAVTAAGAIVLLMAVPEVIHGAVGGRWFTLTGLAALSGLALLGVRGVPANVSIGEVFSFAALFMFGPAAGVLTSAVDSIGCDLRLRHAHPVQLAYNVAAPALSLWVAASTVYGLAGAPLPSSPAAPALAAGAGAALTIALYCALETGLLAVALGLQRRESVPVVWRGLAHLWVGPIVCGYAGFLVARFVDTLPAESAMWLLPVPVLLYLAIGAWFGRLNDRVARLEERTREYQAVVQCLATAVDAKDEVTHGHVMRVQEYGRALAMAAGAADPGTLEALDAACVLHDIGKLGIPERILNKPGRLTPAEFEVMKQHVDIGVRILSRAAAMQSVLPIVQHHHENWDGSGYPAGLRGHEIALGARILMIVDCFDALTSDRPYRRRLSVDEALDILRARRGRMYDPELVDAFIRVQPTLGHLRAPDEAPAGPPLRIAVPPPPATVSRVLEGVASAVPGWTVTWWERDGEAQRALLRAAAGPTAERLVGLTMPDGGGVSGWVLTHREPLAETDGRLDLAGVVEMASVVPCVSEPLELQGRRGTLTLYRLDAQGVSVNLVSGRLEVVLAGLSLRQSSRISRLPALAPS